MGGLSIVFHQRRQPTSLRTVRMRDLILDELANSGTLGGLAGDL